MANAYISLDELKGTGALDITGTAYDTRLRHLIEAVSRQADRYTNRAFYFYTGTKTFSGDGSQELPVPDLIAVTSLKEDTTMDGTFDTTWAAADYMLRPLNAEPTKDWGRPYDFIAVNPKSNGSQDKFVGDTNNYEIVGTWGYRKLSVDSGRTGTLANGTAISATLSGTADLEVGQTWLLGSEQIYVTGIVSGTATVERAKNGSTGTAHTGSAINIVQYPDEVREAVFIQASRLWKRKDSGFAQEIGMPETGQLTAWRGGLDADVKALLEPYRKVAVGVGI